MLRAYDRLDQRLAATGRRQRHQPTVGVMVMKGDPM
jgi:hypothetical protein